MPLIPLLGTNHKKSINKNSGQSAVEFVLIAPSLFFIFFFIFQFFYTAFISFAVQRATYSIAQQAASSSNPTSFDPKFQIIEALLPIEQLNSSILAYTFATQCTICIDGANVDVKVSYPMPIWVPIIKNLIGQNLNNQQTASSFIPTSLINVLQAVGLSCQSLNASQNLTKVLWITFEAHALDENSVGTRTS